jgi:hypothetical protein
MMFGRKKKQEQPESPDPKVLKKRLELANKSIDISKLVAGIESFLTKSDDPFDANIYSLYDFPEKNLKVFKIEHGMRKPRTTFLVVIEGNSNDLRILDHLPTNYANYAAALLISTVIFFPSIINAQVFYNKLWDFIEKTAVSLEGSVS